MAEYQATQAIDLAVLMDIIPLLGITENEGLRRLHADAIEALRHFV